MALMVFIYSWVQTTQLCGPGCCFFQA